MDLGNPLTYPLSTTNAPTTPSRPSTPDPTAGSSAAWTPEKQTQAHEQLKFLQDELLKTERSYVQRVRALKGVSLVLHQSEKQYTDHRAQSYADPLRRFAKSPATQIIPLYEAKTLFANIDAIVPAAVAFLSDLESMSARGWTVGDVSLRHVSFNSGIMITVLTPTSLKRSRRSTATVAITLNKMRATRPSMTASGNTHRSTASSRSVILVTPTNERADISCRARSTRQQG